MLSMLLSIKFCIINRLVMPRSSSKDVTGSRRESSNRPTCQMQSDLRPVWQKMKGERTPEPAQLQANTQCPCANFVGIQQSSLHWKACFSIKAMADSTLVLAARDGEYICC